jgi:hypothetical protein
VPKLLSGFAAGFAAVVAGMTRFMITPISIMIFSKEARKHAKEIIKCQQTQEVIHPLVSGSAVHNVQNVQVRGTQLI